MDAAWPNLVCNTPCSLQAERAADKATLEALSRAAAEEARRRGEGMVSCHSPLALARN